MLAPGGAHCGGGSEFASSVPPRGPGAPLDRAPSGAGGGLPAGRRPGCARGPPQVAGSGSGLEPLHPPPGRDPRWAPTRPNPALFGPNFSGFLPPCGAASRGGGGAPPTTLILLRNQRSARERRARRASGAVRGASGPVRGAWRAEKRPKKTIFFFEGRCLFEVRGRGVAIACGDVAVGRPRGRPPPLRGSPTEWDGGLPAAPTQLARS